MPATKHAVQSAIHEARAAIKRARAILDDLGESYAEDLANTELGPHGCSDEVRVLSDGAELLREAGEHLATADDDLQSADALVDSA